MSAAIIDASVAAGFVLPDEQSSVVDAARRSVLAFEAFAPTIFWYEIRNLVLTNERRGRLSTSQAQVALRELSALPITLLAPNGDAVMALAWKYRLSAYDAAYLALACGKGAPLLTFDKALADAAQREGLAPS